MYTFSETLTDLLRRGHAVRFAVRGQSMHPALRAWDVVIAEPAGPGDVRWRDILVFRSPRGLAVHRVLRTDRDGAAFVARGDAIDGAVERVLFADLLGRVVAVERAGRTRRLGTLRANLLGTACARAVRLKRWLGRWWHGVRAGCDGQRREPA
jgi:hypothetical protein